MEKRETLIFFNLVFIILFTSFVSANSINITYPLNNTNYVQSISNLNYTISGSDFSRPQAQKEKAVGAQEKISVTAQKKKIRVGIIGCGLMGNMHLTAFKNYPEVEIVAYLGLLGSQQEDLVQL